ncbi:MAG: hypothetical protein SNJ78_05615, partial [Spirochaetales bacterium]
AGKEILKRIQTIEEGIQEKFSTTDALAERIKEYDKVLADLIEMTRRAEENILRIKDESVFVDETAKKIKILNSRLEAQETKISGLIKNFEELNQKQLEVVWHKLQAHSVESIKQLENRIAFGMEKANGISVFLQSVEAKLREEAANTEKQLYKSSEDLISEVSQRLSAIEESYSQRLAEVARKGELLETKALQMLKEHIEEKMRATYKDLATQIEGEKANVKTQMDELERLLYQMEAEARTSIREEMAGLKEALATSQKTLEESQTEFSKVSQEKIASLAAQMQALSQQVEVHIVETEEKVHGNRNNVELLVRQTNQRLGELKENFQKDFSQFQEDLGQVQKDMQRIHAHLQNEARNFEALIKKTFQEEEDKVQKQAETLQAKLLERLETRLQEQEQAFAYRFAKIEEISTEIDNLEQNLQAYMDRTRARLQEEFTKFGKQLQAERMQDREEAAKAMEDLRKEMAELEQGLAELKTRAYENVSEKLKIFEDEFFQDLKTRDQLMQSKFIEWQSKVDGALDALMTEEREERKKIEQRYNEELSTVLQDFESRFRLQIETIQTEIEGFRKQTDFRLHEFDKSQQQYQAEMAQGMEENRLLALEAFKETFSRHQRSIKEEMERFEKEAENKVRSITESVEGKKKELEAWLESLNSEVTLWRAKLQEDMKTGESEIHNQFTGFKVQVSNTLGALREEFLKQKNELVASTEEERKQLKEELELLSERTEQLRESLHTKTEEALRSFREGYLEFQEEFQKKAKELQQEAETKLRDFRTFMRDTQDRFEALHQKLFGKLEESTKLLSLTLSEIEKKQRAFIEQTKIFDRADTLKQTLLEQIEGMKIDLKRIEEDRKELKETEALFLRVRKLGEEATEKLARFTAEKRRIDSIEEDFKRLMAMSEGIEVKLRQVATSEDGLQSIQANLRSLQSLQHEVEGRFERLEKKRKFLDLTVEGIDKNFQTLQEMEKRVNTLEQEIRNLPEEVEHLANQLRALSEGKLKAEETIQKIGQIDLLLKELEDRAANLLRAREWLAKTETRLQELSKEAQDQVKLLGSLLKEGAKGPGKAERGSPSLSAREMVTKLAHQGWTVEQIAAATKLSRGEVELILELSGKS